MVRNGLLKLKKLPVESLVQGLHGFLRAFKQSWSAGRSSRWSRWSEESAECPGRYKYKYPTSGRHNYLLSVYRTVRRIITRYTMVFKTLSSKAGLPGLPDFGVCSRVRCETNSPVTEACYATN